MNSIQFKIKQLLRFHCCCHGNYVCMAVSYVADVCHLKEPPCQIQTQYNLNQGIIELLWQLSHHSSKVCVDAYCPKEPPYQMLTQYGLRQRSY